MCWFNSLVVNLKQLFVFHSCVILICTFLIRKVALLDVFSLWSDSGKNVWIVFLMYQYQWSYCCTTIIKTLHDIAHERKGLLNSENEKADEKPPKKIWQSKLLLSLPSVESNRFWQSARVGFYLMGVQYYNLPWRKWGAVFLRCGTCRLPLWSWETGRDRNSDSTVRQPEKRGKHL